MVTAGVGGLVGAVVVQIVVRSRLAPPGLALVPHGPRCAAATSRPVGRQPTEAGGASTHLARRMTAGDGLVSGGQRVGGRGGPGRKGGSMASTRRDCGSSRPIPWPSLGRGRSGRPTSPMTLVRERAQDVPPPKAGAVEDELQLVSCGDARVVAGWPRWPLEDLIVRTLRRHKWDRSTSRGRSGGSQADGAAVTTAMTARPAMTARVAMTARCWA